MKKTQLLLATGLSGLLAASTASAINIDTVFVGDAGNGSDRSGFGGVSYDYRIGTHEVTNSQYTAFLNAKAGSSDPFSLYNSNMGSSSFGGITNNGGGSFSVKSGFENKPVNFVSFWDAARFSNWLTNGQGSGDTETGMYNLGGVTNPTNGSVTARSILVSAITVWPSPARMSGIRRRITTAAATSTTRRRATPRRRLQPPPAVQTAQISIT